MTRRLASSSKLTRLATLAAGLAALALPAAARAAERQPVVVELFTSQGCSSCPPANANLATLSERPGILALSFGVTYWDYLGWKDTFARPDYTARQRVYEGPLGEGGQFTPQMVVEGRHSTVGNDLSQVEHLVADSRRSASPALSWTGGGISVGSGAAPSGGADVWLVRYDPHVVQVPVKRGENGGRTLPHKNVVRDLRLVGHWTGHPETLRFSRSDGGLKTAVLVQGRGGGPILAAASE